MAEKLQKYTRESKGIKHHVQADLRQTFRLPPYTNNRELLGINYA